MSLVQNCFTTCSTTAVPDLPSSSQNLLSSAANHPHYPAAHFYPQLEADNYPHFTSSNFSWSNSAVLPSPAEFHHHSPRLNCYSAPSSPNQSPDHYGNSNAGYVSSVQYATASSSHYISEGTTILPRVRVVKRRNTANKKERRRTMSINNAFTELRDCIPNVPADTKLSKIKTLRLATSYISYLMAVLEAGKTDVPFRAELGRNSKQEKQNNFQRESQLVSGSIGIAEQEKDDEEIGLADKQRKGRTGWPHHVWALELK